MKRSEINHAIRDATSCFGRNGWTLPPSPRWDVTDFGLAQFPKYGLVLVNLAEEPEYCEKLMFAYLDQHTPAHTHRKKKEDIICRHGQLTVQIWNGHPDKAEPGGVFSLPVNGSPRKVVNGDIVILDAGERITLSPGIYHEFWPTAEDTIIGEVSTANDDTNDNLFVDPNIGRFPEIEEDEPPTVKLISDR